jgi:hypothetical protein
MLREKKEKKSCTHASRVDKKNVSKDLLIYLLLLLLRRTKVHAKYYIKKKRFFQNIYLYK